MLEQYAFFRMQRDRSDDNSSARESPVVCAQDQQQFIKEYLAKRAQKSAGFPVFSC